MYKDLKDLLVKMNKKITKLRNAINFVKIIFPSDGTLVVPVNTSDPASPVNGQIWYNSTSHTYKGREDGVTVTFTTS